MSTIKPRRKIEARTVETPVLLPPVDLRAARETILDVLFRLALKGNVTAAKVYLTVTNPDAVTADDEFAMDDAVKLLRENHDS
jgi:hypothetical protein